MHSGYRGLGLWQRTFHSSIEHSLSQIRRLAATIAPWLWKGRAAAISAPNLAGGSPRTSITRTDIIGTQLTGYLQVECPDRPSPRGEVEEHNVELSACSRYPPCLGDPQHRTNASAASASDIEFTSTPAI